MACAWVDGHPVDVAGLRVSYYCVEEVDCFSGFVNTLTAVEGGHIP